MGDKYPLNQAILHFKNKLKSKLCQHERADLPLKECPYCGKTVYRCLKCGSYYILDYQTGVGHWQYSFPLSLIERERAEEAIHDIRDKAEKRNDD